MTEISLFGQANSSPGLPIFKRVGATSRVNLEL